MDILHSTWTLYTKGIVWLDIVVELKQKIVAQALYPTGCIHKKWLIYFMTKVKNNPTCEMLSIELI